MELFDFDARWHEVQAVLDRPRVATALDIAMESICIIQNVTWDRDKGPWFYGDRSFHPTPPEPNSPAWYRPYMFCCQINTWAAVLAEEIEPSLHWRVLVAADAYHLTCCGFADGMKPELLVDLVWDWDEKGPKTAAEIYNEVSARGPMKSWGVNEAVEVLAAQTRHHLAVLPLLSDPECRQYFLRLAESRPGFRKFLKRHGVQ